MAKNKQKKYDPLSASKAAMRKAVIGTVGLAAWVGKNRVIPDKKKKTDRERCRSTDD